MSKKEISHVDLIGNELNVGDFVAAHYFNSLTICKVTKINPKMIQVHPVKYHTRKKNVYPHDMVRISPDDVTMYLLRNK